MRAGSLDTLIELWHSTLIADSFGQPVAHWLKLADLWANVRFLNGREFITADKETAETKVSFRIRDYPVTQQMQIRLDGKIYEISAVLPAVRKGYMDLPAKEIV